MKTRSDIRALVRLAYEGQPELAGLEARAKGLYMDFLTHMMRVHGRLTYQYLTERERHARTR